MVVKRGKVDIRIPCLTRGINHLTVTLEHDLTPKSAAGRMLAILLILLANSKSHYHFDINNEHRNHIVIPLLNSIPYLPFH